LRRSSSSPFASSPRQKPGGVGAPRRKSSPADETAYDAPLDDTGIAASLAADLELRDVPQFMQNIQRRMWCHVPERSGMNGQRIAEVLNHRLALPPIVSTAHVHALTKSPTITEREIADLTRAGVLRKIVIPGRGASVGEGLIIVSEWERRVYAHPDLDNQVKDKYTSLLRADPSSFTVSAAHFTKQETTALISAGFLTFAGSPTNAFNRPGVSPLGFVTSIATASASGSLGAVGGADALISSGGGGSGILTNPTRSSVSTDGDWQYHFAMPNTGPYLKLLISARAHLIDMLDKMSKHREAPLSLLKERWDGGIMTENAASRAKRARGEWTGTLPGRTKKWRGFYGLNFDWVLEECVGSGQVELFQTRTVGVGVR
ncbi:hypothetical protein K490DRAFT_14265, partial [Saccharata proteae CBS 121410]